MCENKKCGDCFFFSTDYCPLVHIKGSYFITANSEACSKYISHISSLNLLSVIMNHMREEDKGKGK